MRPILQLTLAVAVIGFGTASTFAKDPTGEGPPDSKSCRRNVAATGSIVPGPDTCLTNKQWIALHAKNLTISADGKSVVSANGGYYNSQEHFLGDNRDMVPRGEVTNTP